MEYKESRATPEDFVIGTAVAAGVLGVMAALLVFGKEILLAIF